jgi:hypothetical protein
VDVITRKMLENTQKYTGIILLRVSKKYLRNFV